MHKFTLNRAWKHLLLVTGMLFWSAGVLCGGDNKNTQIFKKFNEALSYIYFPGSQEILDNCYVKQEKRCIANYKRAIEAKNNLFSYGPESALDATLSAIGANCKGGKRTNNAICNGAVDFLFFFNSSEFDKKILEYFSTANSEVTLTVFETTTGYWLQTRQDKNKWLKFVSSSKAFDDSKRQGYKNVINDSLDYDVALQLIKNNTAE